jgi:hypothetical protein
LLSLKDTLKKLLGNRGTYLDIVKVGAKKVKWEQNAIAAFDFFNTKF